MFLSILVSSLELNNCLTAIYQFSSRTVAKCVFTTYLLLRILIKSNYRICGYFSLNCGHWTTGVVIELLCGYWTNKKENCDSYDRCYNSRQNKVPRSNYYAWKVNHLKETKPSQWWSAVKWIADMTLAPGSDSLFTNLQIEGSALLSEQEIVNEINSVFL